MEILHSWDLSLHYAQRTGLALLGYLKNVSRQLKPIYELLGDAGILSEKKSSPVYDVLKMIKEFDAKWIIKRYNNDEVIINGFIAENTNEERLVLKSTIF